MQGSVRITDYSDYMTLLNMIGRGARHCINLPTKFVAGLHAITLQMKKTMPRDDTLQNVLAAWGRGERLEQLTVLAKYGVSEANVENYPAFLKTLQGNLDIIRHFIDFEALANA